MVMDPLIIVILGYPINAFWNVTFRGHSSFHHLGYSKIEQRMKLHQGKARVVTE